MEFHIDAASIFLLSIILLIIVYNYLFVHSYDVHPTFCRNQSITSPTRNINESATLRHRVNPFNSELTDIMSRQLDSLKKWIDDWLNDANLVNFEDKISKVDNVKAKLNQIINSILNFYQFKQIQEFDKEIFIAVEHSNVNTLLVILACFYYNIKISVIQLKLLNDKVNLTKFLKDTKQGLWFIEESMLDSVIELFKQQQIKTDIIVLDKQVNKIRFENISVNSFETFLINDNRALEIDYNKHKDIIEYNDIDKDNQGIVTNSFNSTHVYAAISAYHQTFPNQFTINEEDKYHSTLSIVESEELTRVLYFLSRKSTVIVNNNINKTIPYEHIKPTVLFLDSKQLCDFLLSTELQFIKVNSEGYNNLFSMKPYSLFKSIQQTMLNFSLSVMQDNCHLLNNIINRMLFNKYRQSFGNQLKLIVINDPSFDKSISNVVRILLNCQLQTQVSIVNSFGPAFISLFYDYINQQDTHFVGVPLPSLEIKVHSIIPEPLENKLIIGKAVIKGNSINNQNQPEIILGVSKLHNFIWFGYKNEILNLNEVDKVHPISLSLLEAWLIQRIPLIYDIKLQRIEDTLKCKVQIRHSILKQLIPLLKLDDQNYLQSKRLIKYLLEAIQVETNLYLQSLPTELSFQLPFDQLELVE